MTRDGVIRARPARVVPLTPALFHVLLALVDGENGYAVLKDVAQRTGGRVQLGIGPLGEGSDRGPGDHALLLVVAAGLLVRTVLALGAVELGFDPHNVPTSDGLTFTAACANDRGGAGRLFAARPARGVRRSRRRASA